MIKKLLNATASQRHEQRKVELYRNLIRREAKIGGKLFGDIQKSANREFFCLDEHTWVWHEEWLDEKGVTQSRMTRYDIRPNGIIKSQNGHYKAVSRHEAQNLLAAAREYRSAVMSQLYGPILS